VRVVVALSLSGLFLTRPLYAAAGWERNGFDEDDLAYVTRHDPQAGVLLHRGESELKAGSLRSAADLFGQVVARVPDSSLAARRYCQALAELGQRREALVACQTAVKLHPTPPGFRALVRALMSAPPTPQESVLATSLAAAAKRQMSDQPWGDAAMSDIGQRTGDEPMLADSVDELERIAPGHYETIRARAALDTFRLARWAWGAWLGLALAVVGTMCHAAWTALARSRRGRRAALTLAASLLVGVASLFSAANASAEPDGTAADATPPPGGLSKWSVDDSNPVKSLPTTQQRDRNPLEYGYHLMDLADKADIARRKGDWRGYGKYYEAIAVAVPDHAIGYRRSCEGYEKAGDTAKALQMCRGAMGGDGVELADYTQFAKLTFAKTEPLSPDDIQDLTDIVAHLKSQPGTVPVALDIQCELAQHLDDVKRLEQCSADVAKATPNDPKLVIYQWGIAMKHEDYSRAQQLLDVAHKQGLKPAGIEMMERMTQEQSAIGGRILRAAQRHPGAVGVLLGLLSVLGLSFAMRRRLKLRAA
jgi:tetratricopeptide (TPR) repeat protein